MFHRDHIEYKTAEQVQVMRRAGVVVADALAVVRDQARPGVTTAELDEAAERSIREAGAVPSFLGYGDPPFTGSVCLSVNDEVVHGLPGSRVLAEGDLVSVDCGAIVDGWHGDAAFSMVVGSADAADPADLALVRATEDALWQGIAALAVGERLHAIGSAVQEHVESVARDGGPVYGIVEEYVGHGIGTQMHQEPQVPNHRVRDRGPRVRAGLVVAVEPMLTRGTPATRVLDDEWTVVTADGSRAAHAEHTVAVTDRGLWVLTAADGGRARLAELGVPCVAQPDHMS
ncbi:MAG: type I methionyl aminopeptidase [Angustibacter sp.]